MSLFQIRLQFLIKIVIRILDEKLQIDYQRKEFWIYHIDLQYNKKSNKS